MDRCALAVCVFLAVTQGIPVVSANSDHRASEPSHRDTMNTLLQSLFEKHRGQEAPQQAAPRTLDLPAPGQKRESFFSGPQDHLSALKDPISPSLHLLRVTGARAISDTEQKDREFLSGNLGTKRRPKKYEFIEDMKREFEEKDY